MELSHEDIINAPCEDVYKIVRDDLSSLSDFLPNIKKIDQKEYKRTGQLVRVVNHWYADAEVPKLLSKFISEEFFSWQDKAEWDDATKSVEYELTSFLANDLFEARGKNYFEAFGNKTKLRITCSIQIFPEKIPGVPKLLARQVQPLVEKLVEKMIGPNLTSLGGGLRKYLEAHQVRS